MARKKVKVQDIINAIRQNGYKQGIGAYFRDSFHIRLDGYLKEPEKHQIHEACAMGQAVINLGIDREPVVHSATFQTFYGSVIRLNDSARYTPQMIADTLDNQLSTEFKNRVLTFEEFDYEPYMKEIARND